MFKKLTGIIFLVALLLYFLKTYELEKDIFYIETSSGVIKLELEIADYAADIAKGLSGRSNLSESSGMLFIFSKPKILTFWMKDTKIPLDLLFLDKNMVIKEVHKSLIPYDKTEVTSKRPYIYALELNAGFVESHKVNIGDRLIRAYN